MSDLFDRFTGFRSFVNPLQDDLISIYVALESLDNTTVSSPEEAAEFIDDLGMDDILRRYSNRSSSSQNYELRLTQSLNRINFANFKSLIGDVSYV